MMSRDLLDGDDSAHPDHDVAHARGGDTGVLFQQRYHFPPLVASHAENTAMMIPIANGAMPAYMN